MSAFGFLQAADGGGDDRHHGDGKRHVAGQLLVRIAMDGVGGVADMIGRGFDVLVFHEQRNKGKSPHRKILFTRRPEPGSLSPRFGRRLPSCKPRSTAPPCPYWKSS